MLTLILRDLQYRKWRVLAATLLMAIILMLLFVMAGVVGQFDREPFEAAERIGGDRSWVIAETSTGPLTSPVAVPESALAGIDGALPFLIGFSNANDGQAMVVGRSFNGMDEPTLSAGRYPSDAGEAVVDATLGVAMGDRFRLGANEMTVVGLTNDATIAAGVPMLFTTLDQARATLASGEAIATGALVEASPSELPSGLKVLSGNDVGQDARAPLESAVDSVRIVTSLLWLVTAIVIASMIYITALERTGDFAVLKAVGGRNRSLATSLLVQGLVMAVLAALIGAVLQFFVAPAFPLKVSIPSSAFITIPVVAAIIAMVAGLAGVWRMSRTSPVEAFG